MEKKEYSIECGRASFDDSRKISIPGQLILCHGSKKLLICTGGLTGDYRDYLPYFADKLGADFNVYMTQLRNKGFANVDNCARDLVQIDKHLRKTLGIENVVHVGHSMGMNVVARSREFSDAKLNGFYGISSYPSYGDTRTRSSDLDEKELQQMILDFASKLNYGPIGSPLKEHLFEEPVRFAIAGNDELLDLRGNPKVLERFKKYFSRNPQGSTRVFDGKNHCFNHAPWDFKPFNRDDSKQLIDDIKDFSERV